ncbi:MAG: outer membrane assembly protein [Tannerellaceae bacterium]|nr:outer membrane assembly protein [Tannerellaceae bacterium]
MKNKKKIWIISIAVLSFILIGIPAIAFGILKWGVLPPEKLTPLVINQANKMLNGRLECDRIELTFFETCPRLGVRVYEGALISQVAKDSLSLADSIALPTDTLLSFTRALISVNPLDYLFRNQITIGGIFIEEPSIYAYMNEEGVANWDILPEDGETEDEDEETEQTEPLPPIDLQRVRVKDGQLIYDDRQADMYAAINDLSLRLNGGLLQEGNKIELEVETSSVVFEDREGDMYSEIEGLKGKLKGMLIAGGTGMKLELATSSILFDSPNYTLKNKLAVDFKSIIVLTEQFNKISLRGAEMMVNDLPFTADGVIINQPDSNRMQVNLDMSLKASDLNDLLDFIPDEYFLNRKNIEAKGSVSLESSIYGFVGDSIVPTINLACKIENGSYFMKDIKQGIDRLEMDMDVHLNGTSPDSSYVTLEQLAIEGLNTSFTLKGKVEDIFGSPAIDAYMKGTVDFTRLAKEFLNPDTLLLRGKMDADISASFVLDDLLDGRYNHVNAAGQLDIDELRTFSKAADMRLYVAGMHFHVDSSKQTSSFVTNTDLLAAFLTVDTMSVRYKNEINTNLKGIDIQVKTSPVVDTTAVMPLTTRMKVEHLRTRLPDSVWVVARNSSLVGGIKPSDSDKTKPNFAGAITVDTLRYVDVPLGTGAVLSSSVFAIEALPYRDAMRRRRQAQQATDTTATRRRVQRAPAERQRTRQQSSVSPATEDSSGKLLRNWEVKGTVKFNDMRLFSRMFPLRMHMEQTIVRFDTNTLTFKEAVFHAGKSDFKLTGEVNSIRRAMLSGGKLKADFAVNSDYIDCNQLVQAMNRGMQYMEQLDARQKQQLMEEETVEDLEGTIQELSVETEEPEEELFVVPALLDMTFNMNAKRIDYTDLELENVTGEVVMRNQSINLKKLAMDSNIGRGNLTMVYTAKDKTSASAGFELDMEDILVDKLIGLFPSIDSLLPMLRSFEGIVDCQMAATCELDSTMSLILPSMHSACYLRGENMVLLDGETFSEISKTLMFKNKNRNLIDNISVDLVIQDNKIEVFPFLVEMDRYRVAVGGVHHLDMTFDYHLSVLKSPVPFKLGIDITGNLDKFKYRIVKCRYKDIFKPAYEQEMDATRINLRSEIREAIRKEMQANAPELAGNLNFEDNFSRRSNTNRQRPVTDKEETESDIQNEN